MNFLVSENTLKNVFSYLIKRPYQEVEELIVDLKKSQEIKEVVKEDEIVEEEKKE